MLASLIRTQSIHVYVLEIAQRFILIMVTAAPLDWQISVIVGKTQSHACMSPRQNFCGGGASQKGSP